MIGSRQVLISKDTMCEDCSILIEEPEVHDKVLWEGMQLVAPWENDAVSDDIFTINPTFIPRDRLSSAQQSVSSSAHYGHMPFCSMTWQDHHILTRLLECERASAHQ